MEPVRIFMVRHHIDLTLLSGGHRAVRRQSVSQSEVNSTGNREADQEKNNVKQRKKKTMAVSREKSAID